jgi:hypothetical protein
MAAAACLARAVRLSPLAMRTAAAAAAAVKFKLDENLTASSAATWPAPVTTSTLSATKA